MPMIMPITLMIRTKIKRRYGANHYNQGGDTHSAYDDHHSGRQHDDGVADDDHDDDHSDRQNSDGVDDGAVTIIMIGMVLQIMLRSL